MPESGNTKFDIIVENIKDELNRAESRWPSWLEDPIHAAGVVSEEAGELVRAANRYVYENEPSDEMYVEAVQTAVVAIRFLAHMSIYKRTEAKRIFTKPMGR